MMDPVSQVNSPTNSAKAKAAKRSSALEIRDDEELKAMENNDMVSQQ